MKRWIGWGAVVAVCVCSWVYHQYVEDMSAAYARIRLGSTVIGTPWGEVEYAIGGAGEPVLVVHGSGGGFDQGQLIARALLPGEFQYIAPSRFGYLRSTHNPSATFDDQAHAFARLLDHLRIDRVAVVALSHGGPSALLFALMYPERVSSLALLSAGVASSNMEDQDAANVKGRLLTFVYQHDWLYWGLTHAFRRSFLELLGASDEVIDALDPESRGVVDEIVDYMNPVLPRAAGVFFDNQAELPNERIRAINVPTLVVHARDDGLQLFHNAESAQQWIRGARLVAFERGGHVVIAVERARIRALLAEHILAHSAGDGRRHD